MFCNKIQTFVQENHFLFNEMEWLQLRFLTHRTIICFKSDEIVLYQNESPNPKFFFVFHMKKKIFEEYIFTGEETWIKIDSQALYGLLKACKGEGNLTLEFTSNSITGKMKTINSYEERSIKVLCSEIFNFDSINILGIGAVRLYIPLDRLKKILNGIKSSEIEISYNGRKTMFLTSLLEKKEYMFMDGIEGKISYSPDRIPLIDLTESNCEEIRIEETWLNEGNEIKTKINCTRVKKTIDSFEEKYLVKIKMCSSTNLVVLNFQLKEGCEIGISFPRIYSVLTCINK